MNPSSPIDLQVTVQDMPTGVVVRLCGSVGVAEADTLRSRLAPVAAGGALNIVLDLSEMDFISSPGLSILLKLAQRARTWEGMVKLVNPRPVIRDLFERTRLTEIFPIYATVDEALRR